MAAATAAMAMMAAMVRRRHGVAGRKREAAFGANCGQDADSATRFSRFRAGVIWLRKMYKSPQCNVKITPNRAHDHSRASGPPSQRWSSFDSVQHDCLNVNEKALCALETTPPDDNKSLITTGINHTTAVNFSGQTPAYEDQLKAETNGVEDEYDRGRCNGGVI
ncbi:hypothetical protein EVG20_g5679 [Dentipellis fragilis]|uniref:Uncharacterized protein n=1 Tax=Dentipellis fragilis TaxID=205917 RepID=A0A4Y9YU06_9AGAM|nr:hypothetical protein EVG20_g5679 [Dentipellis fragilis]